MVKKLIKPLLLLLVLSLAIGFNVEGNFASASDSIKKVSRTVGTHTFTNSKSFKVKGGKITASTKITYTVKKSKGPVKVSKVVMKINNNSSQSPYVPEFYIDRRSSNKVARYGSQVIIGPHKSQTFTWNANASDAQSVNLYVVSSLALNERIKLITSFY
ncbi:hypothetical protein [Macrococcus equipercicus]|uniref:DUF5067 domain-containing protein n=1 Tax=Macrococcus equipercicus TaxID=69967 RepID=A0A9Q9BNN5_9STAP|nr:hypothetical protein [Macrococcus equipercicus]UTH14450.1 hypothetical protein KFV11_03570 [Macrococcus equipercicus]